MYLFLTGWLPLCFRLFRAVRNRPSAWPEITFSISHPLNDEKSGWSSAVLRYARAVNSPKGPKSVHEKSMLSFSTIHSRVADCTDLPKSGGEPSTHRPQKCMPPDKNLNSHAVITAYKLQNKNALDGSCIKAVKPSSAFVFQCGSKQSNECPRL